MEEIVGSEKQGKSILKMFTAKFIFILNKNRVCKHDVFSTFADSILINT